jgi:hypothetical protein
MKKTMIITAMLLLLTISLLAQVNGTLNQIGNKKILQVWGSNYQRGYAQGYYLGPQIVEVFNDMFWTMFCYSNLPHYNMLLSYYNTHFSTPEDMFWEALGIAEGMADSSADLYHAALGRNLDSNDILLMNAMFDLVDVRNRYWQQDNLELGCATLSSKGTATAADSLLAGSGVITRFFDATQNSALINNPVMVIHHPEQDNQVNWLNITLPGFFGALTAISETGLFSALNIGPNSTASITENLTPVIFSIRRGIEQYDYDGNGVHHPYDVFESMCDGRPLNGAIVHNLAETPDYVYHSVIETRNSATLNRVEPNGSNLPANHLAATNHFRSLASPVCCDRYAQLQDSLYADPNVSAKRQWRVMSGAAGLETTLTAVQFIPISGDLLWAAASLTEPAYTQPAISLNAYELMNQPVGNEDDYLPSPTQPISLYPNPLPKDKALGLSSPNPLDRIEIYNLKGQRIFTQALNGAKGNLTLPLPSLNLARGVYLLKSVFTNGQKGTAKLVLL